MFSASKTAGPSGYNIANSLRFRASASAYLSRTPASAGNRQTWTWSGWVKRGSLGAYRNFFAGGASGYADGLTFTSSDTFYLSFANSALSGEEANLTTNQVFRDPSAWYHIVVATDTTQATAANRIKLYVNGTQISSFSTAVYPSQNFNCVYFNNASLQTLGALYGTTWPFDGYLADINFIDGQALTPSSFGEIDSTTGVWKARRYTGTYGTNGFKLNFSNGTSTTTLGYDSSGNGNNWTTNNVSLTAGSTYDWMIDSPTKFPGSSYGVGNYAVLNPLEGSGKSNGNLSLAGQSSGNSTIQVSSGKWYAEYVIGSTLDAYIGVARANTSSVPVAYRQDGTRYTGSAWVAYGASYSAGDVISIAFDLDAGTAQFFKNNTSQGVISGVSYSTACGVTVYVTTSNSCVVNFGQRPFAYTPPSGYKSLCTQNLPGVTIQNGAAYMAATTYTGNGSTQSISNAVNSVSFQPDFVWVKSRSSAGNHSETDSVRGVNKQLFTNLTDAEGSQTDQVTAFNSGGFSLGANAAGTGSVNVNGVTYVAWQWKAGGTAVTNTAGSITSSVSANAAAGFSVVTFTTQSSGTGTVGHGLGVAPSLIILKGRALVTNWSVYHTSVGNTGRLVLNTTASTDTNVVYWNNASPTSSVFTLGTNYADSSTYVAYCFAAIPGYSAFGSYTGNGSSDGPFVYLGFRPRFILTKMTNTSGNYWIIHDTTRDPYNVATQRLYPNVSDAEATVTDYDILSNGFKLRTSAEPNGSGNTFIYAAFAENPFQNALAR